MRELTRGHNRRRAMKLSRAALAFRAFHAAIAVEMLLAIAYVWWCALSGRRDRLLRLAAASLIGEGVLVAANHGDCPLGGLIYYLLTIEIPHFIMERRMLKGIKERAE